MFRCSECGSTSQKWQWKCLQCGGWNTLEEVLDTPKKKWSNGISWKERVMSGFVVSEWVGEKVQLQSAELNTTLGGGLTPGSLILLSGEPGIGKSTLALQIADWFATDLTTQLSQSSGVSQKRSNLRKDRAPKWDLADATANEEAEIWTQRSSFSEARTAIYVSAEENIRQISERAKRLGVDNAHIRLFTANLLEDILETIEHDPSPLIIVDSVSMIASGNISSSSGSITQVRSVTEAFMEFSKRTGRSVVLIGHVTKDGTISGPKVLEHLVDTVLFLEGSRYEDYRILRTLKNRFGPTDEIGLFRMTEQGLEDMKNPGAEFINPENEKLSGSALTLTMEGNRPILVEIEALTTYTKFGYPKRSTRGITTGKLDLLLAVLTKWGNLKLESYDVYINVARGLSLSEPGVDLATIAAIISSKSDIPLGRQIFLGEVSLTGVVKHISGLSRRIDEAAKLGFNEIICPKLDEKKIRRPDGVTIREISHVREIAKFFSV